MQEHRRRRATPHTPATPRCPEGFGGAGPPASLPLLDGAHATDFVAAPRIRPRGARNAGHPNTRTGS